MNDNLQFIYLFVLNGGKKKKIGSLEYFGNWEDFWVEFLKKKKNSKFGINLSLKTNKNEEVKNIGYITKEPKIGRVHLICNFSTFSLDVLF